MLTVQPESARKGQVDRPDLFRPGFLEDDVITQHHTCEHGALKVTEGSGFGVTLDHEKLVEFFAEDYA